MFITLGLRRMPDNRSDAYAIYIYQNTHPRHVSIFAAYISHHMDEDIGGATLLLVRTRHNKQNSDTTQVLQSLSVCLSVCLSYLSAALTATLSGVATVSWKSSPGARPWASYTGIHKVEEYNAEKNTYTTRGVNENGCEGLSLRTYTKASRVRSSRPGTGYISYQCMYIRTA